MSLGLFLDIFQIGQPIDEFLLSVAETSCPFQLNLVIRRFNSGMNLTYFQNTKQKLVDEMATAL